MAEEEVGIRLAVKNRREAERDLDRVGDGLDRVGDEAVQVGRKARIGAAGMVAFGKSGRLAGRAVVYGMGAAAAGIVATGIAVTRFSNSAIDRASDLNETVSKSRVIFGKHSRDMLRWSRSADDSLGLSQNAALGTATTFGDLFSQIGFANSRAARLSRGVVKLAADFGSFNNLETEDVLDRVSAAFRGEYDSLQAIVPNINAARVETVALSLAHKKEAKELTAREKALAVLNILHTDGSRAMGDFARTSDGLANQEKILAAQYENASAKLGKSLMPIKLEFIGFLNREGIPLLDRFARWFDNDGIPTIKRYADVFEDRALPVVKDLVDEGRPLAESVLPAIGTGATTIADAFKVIAPRAKAVFDGFNDLPDWAKSAVALTVGGAAVAKKVGVGSLFGRGGAGASIATMAKPLPVYVVNGGAGLPGSPGGKPRAGRFGVLGPQAAALAATGYTAYDLAKTMKPGIERSLVTTGTRSPMTGGTARPSVLAANQAGEALWRASLDKDWPEVIRLVREYGDVIDGSATGTQQLQRVGYAFTQEFGRELQVVVDRLNTADAEANNLRTTLMGVPAIGSYGAGLGVLAPSPSRPRVNRRPKHPSPAIQPSPGGVPLSRTAAGADGGSVHVYVDGVEVSSRVERRWVDQEARR